MGLITLLFQEPLMFFMLVIPLLYSIIFHEMAHGVVALFFGDDTAKRAGRLTLNPASHIDPKGALMLFFVGFGWAKPVPVSYARLRHTRMGIVAVSLAGCVVNILLATIAIFLLQLNVIANNTAFATITIIIARINIILGAFNLIPLPPLDGSRVLTAFLPPSGQMQMARIEPYGFFILIILLFTGILEPVIMFVQQFIFVIIGFLLRLLH